MSFSRRLQRKRTHVPIRFGRSLLMVRSLRAGTFCASPQGVESPVHRCTQAFHRTAFTPLERWGKIVDMIAPVGVLIAAATLAAPAASTLDPQHLPAVPVRGFVVSSGATLAFVDLQGRALGRVEGFRFASENTFGAGVPRAEYRSGRSLGRCSPLARSSDAARAVVSGVRDAAGLPR